MGNLVKSHNNFYSNTNFAFYALIRSREKRSVCPEKSVCIIGGGDNWAYTWRQDGKSHLCLPIGKEIHNLHHSPSTTATHTHTHAHAHAHHSSSLLVIQIPELDFIRSAPVPVFFPTWRHRTCGRRQWGSAMSRSPRPLLGPPSTNGTGATPPLHRPPSSLCTSSSAPQHLYLLWEPSQSLWSLGHHHDQYLFAEAC